MAPADWFFWIALIVLGSLAVGTVYGFLAAEPEDVWLILLEAQNNGEPNHEIVGGGEPSPGS
jgi:hypothetical protein